MEVHRYTLSNGLTVVLAPTGAGHAVHAAVFVRVGSCFETPETNGISHFVEHLLFQGNARFADSAALCAFVEERGGEVNAHTSPDFTQVFVTLHRDYGREAVRTLAALVFDAAVDRWDVEREREIILHERASGGADPDAEIRQRLWPDAPLGFEVSGAAENIDRFSAAALRAHYTTFFRPSNTVLVVAGRFETADLRPVIEEVFGTVSDSGAALPELPEARAATPAPQRAVHDAMGGGCGVMLAVPVCGIHSPDVGPLQAANFLLGGGLSSRLFLRLREEAGLAYDVGSTLAHFHDGGYFLAHAACRREQLVDCTTRLLAEVRDFGQRGVTDGEIARMRRFMHCQVDYRADEPDELAAWYGVIALLERPEALPTPREDAEQIARLSRADVNAVLQRWICPDAATVICHMDGGWWHRRAVRRAMEAGLNWSGP